MLRVGNGNAFLNATGMNVLVYLISCKASSSCVVMFCREAKLCHLNVVIATFFSQFSLFSFGMESLLYIVQFSISKWKKIREMHIATVKMIFSQSNARLELRN